MPRRVTLRDIAKVTGLHFSTIGLALRKDPRVSKATVERVLATAQSLGHRHDPMLSALASYRHARGEVFRGTIGMLISESLSMSRKSIGSSIGLLYEAVKARADELGFKVDLININEPGMTAKRLANVISARGIEGLLLAPITTPGRYLDLPWDKFFTVAVGYSITSPGFHRACFHQARSTWLHLKELRTLGYRRIGLVLSRDSDLRTDHNFLGAYLAEQHHSPDAVQIKPYVSNAFRKDEFVAWLESEKPDCIMGAGREIMDLLGELDFAVPRDMGYSTYSWNSQQSGFAGIDERWSALGVTAFELLIELMKNGEYGLPVFPRFTVVEGQWRPGRTVRRTTASVASK